MSALNTKANISTPDEFYAELLAAHEGLSKPESDAFNARLILLLANHIGDRTVLSQALRAAALKD
ncbi:MULTISPECIES: DUF2783 domain-containing protein [Hoeflea]|uniref:DUF2783 domain-containing protein n=1 Tax=Hoeflea algicola TaxID=2983763 RepID=A0ABT3Z578_9HYPH|nr:MULTISPECIES: DUF2783 domain-containing protein [Hoeflea]MCY0146923.1 DUF2783 domain-containing protein [Hoeflea algicola]